MTNRNFDEWLSKFRPSISSYDYYIDFAKVVRNVDEIKVELNILNSLIGSKNIEEEFEKKVKYNCEKDHNHNGLNSNIRCIEITNGINISNKHTVE